MLGYGLDPTILLVLPAFLLSMYAQYKVNNTFNQYSRVANRRGYTGADVAKQLLTISGIRDVQVEHIRGNLTDHYDPRAKRLRLSDAVYGSTSLAAIGVAAHETGHAVQHAHGYIPLGLRSSIVPLANIGSTLATPLIMLGLLLSSGRGGLGTILLYVGIALFTGVVLFQLVTLPVEFNASSRALKMLENNHFLSSAEIGPARAVLSAAALTYVAAATTAIFNLLRFLMLANANKRRK